MSLGGYVVTEAEVAEGGFGFFELLLRDAAFGLDFDADLELEPFTRGEFGQHSSVEFHPFLVRDFAGPRDASERELLGLFLFCSGFDFQPWCHGLLRIAVLT